MKKILRKMLKQSKNSSFVLNSFWRMVTAANSWIQLDNDNALTTIKHLLNPKRAGLFCLSQVGGGGGGAPPPRISAAERQKILKFGTYVELVNPNVLTKFQYLKSKRFLIMQIYVNYMHVFLFLTITDKIRPFGALKLFWYCRRNI